MHHMRREWGSLIDHPFVHLVRWGLRPRRGAGQRAWRLALGLLTAAIAAAAWWAARQPITADDLLFLRPNLPAAALVATPFRDHVADISQLTFGYTLLRWAAYALVGFAHLTLPIIAAAAMAQERWTGRLEELRLTPLTARDVYLALALSLTLPFLIQGLALVVLFAGVAWGESVPLLEVARLSQDVAGQILLAAFVGVTCSALFRSPWLSVGTACLWLWAVIPLGWSALLMLMNGVSLNAPLWVPFIDERRALEFGFQCTVQALWTAALAAAAFSVGVDALRRQGFARSSHRRSAVAGHGRAGLAVAALWTRRRPQKEKARHARGIGGTGV